MTCDHGETVSGELHIARKRCSHGMSLPLAIVTNDPHNVKTEPVQCIEFEAVEHDTHRGWTRAGLYVTWQDISEEVSFANH